MSLSEPRPLAESKGRLAGALMRGLCLVLSDRRGLVELGITAVILVVALGSRLLGIESRSIWMDEDSQARRVLAGGFDSGLAERAATQQQPPLDYYLEYIGFQLFGITPLGARFHAAVMGALSVVVIYSIVSRMFQSRGPALLAALLALLHPVLIFYSHEARPIASGVFFATLLLYTLLGFMLSRARWPWRTFWWLALSVSSTLFLLSVGFQPLVFIACVASALTLGLFSVRFRWRVLLAWLAFAASGYIALPFLQRTIKRSARYVGSDPLAKAGGIVDQLLELDSTTWSIPWSEFLGHIWPLALFSTAVGVFQLARAGRKRFKLQSSSATVFLLVFVVLFPALFDATFSALVDYRAKTRYYLTLAPALIVLIASLGYYAWGLAASWAGNSARRRAVLRSALVVVVLVSLVLQTQATRAAYLKPRRDWASLYALFREQATLGVAYMLHLVEPGIERPGYYSQRFYYKTSTPRPVALRKQEQLADDCERGRYLKRRSIFVVVRYDWRYIKKVKSKLERDVPGVTVHVFYGTSVIELRSPKRDTQAVTRLFEVLAKHLPSKPESYNAHMALATLKLCQKDYVGARAAVRSMQELAPKSLKRISGRLLAKIARSERQQRRRVEAK